jgi:hypothetical protein
VTTRLLTAATTLAIAATNTFAQQSAAMSARDSVATVARIATAAQAFLGEWRTMWLATQRSRAASPEKWPWRQAVAPSYGTGNVLFSFYQFCLRDLPTHHLARPVSTRIPSARSARWHCPSWPLWLGELAPDMSVAVDSSLSVEQRAVAFAYAIR